MHPQPAEAASPAACTVHDVIEGGWGGAPLIYPYRCARCSQCFCCAHRLRGYRTWLCPDGGSAPCTPSPGTAAAAPPRRFWPF